MYTHTELAALQAQSLKMQGWIRRQTFSPEMEKTLRRFSSWEVSELVFRINQSTFRGRLAAEPSLPAGEVEEDGRQRWFSLDEINELRRRMKINRQSLMPPRPKGKRALRAAIANFKGGAGKSTVALHFRPRRGARRLPGAGGGFRPAGHAQPFHGADRCRRRSIPSGVSSRATSSTRPTG